MIGGDGIGPEVVAAGCRVLEALAAADGGFAPAFEHFDWLRPLPAARWAI